MRTCACGTHALQPGAYLVADGMEHRAGFCAPSIVPSWSPVARRERAFKRHRLADPHCTCNDCMAHFAAQEDRT